ncbi:DNA mismatch repair endonuclease MutL [Lyticum sinuosum]|uniref:DNA mismatch repair protein MutL n=1 Tax=Lyticum sinuosum TaxID=1332059 RepID=A0AAE4VMA8_9RICK|nr:DNA mismatch repair endonuclease MutL [Lyticum sinuosum]MDZ5761289.1 DNA mismatch repair protein MutL [Lyticum sinuosum]
MRKIQLLSPSAISKIAAGEVIERPASVVKELVENSIDSGADEINIIIKNAGITLIEVSDDGGGIDKEDLHLAITSHATSKITSDNINDIRFLGFRGEALASIVSSANVSIISKNSDSDLAWELDVNGKEEKEIRIFSCYREKKGTTVIVRDLFSLIPNKLRFLPSKNNEIATIIELINQFTLINNKIKFKLKIDDKIVINIHENTDISKRIEYVMGINFWNDALKIESHSKYLNISGYIINPTGCTNRGKIITFVNNRVVKDPKIYSSIKIAYNGLIEKKYTPSCVVFIETDSSNIDVNIHPHKTQVKFTNEILMKNDIINSIKNTLRRSSSSITLIENIIDNSILNRINDNNKNKSLILSEFLSEYNNITTKDNINNENIDLSQDSDNLNNYIKLKNNKLLLKELEFSFCDKNKHDEYLYNYKQYHNNTYFNENRPIYSNKILKLGDPICQINNLYIISICHIENALVIIDQHAAHERIVLENMKKTLKNGMNLPKQNLLFSDIILSEGIDFSKDELFIIRENKYLFEKFGIDIQIYESKIEVNSIPSIFGGFISAKDAIIDIIQKVISNSLITEEILLSKIDEICGRIACYSSIKAGNALTVEEMRALIQEIENNDFTSQCNHGRPTYVKLYTPLLEKMFCR